jgi:hypothetical protein
MDYEKKSLLEIFDLMRFEKFELLTFMINKNIHIFLSL